MKKIIWKLLEMLDDNWGYSTSLQKRFKPGSQVTMSKHKKSDTPFRIGEEVVVLENGRHDYLVQNSDGKKWVVYQFEIY